MALTREIEKARRQTATRENRLRQHLAELRLDEIVKVAGIADAYEKADRKGDLRIESAFAAIFQATTDEHVRDLIVKAFVAWQDDEREEERIVRGGVDQSVVLLKHHNDAFINGTFLPEGSEPVA
jgi:hypothetical protein